MPNENSTFDMQKYIFDFLLSLLKKYIIPLVALVKKMAKRNVVKQIAICLKAP